MEVRSAGYTIVEVMLFLAISALLLTIVFLGTGNSLYATRFSDSARSLQSFLQKQYDDIQNGFNDRSNQESCSAGIVNPSPPTGQQGGASDCLLLGKLITLKPGTSVLHVYDIVGTEPASPNYNESDAALIHDYQPTIVTNTDVSTFSIPWQAAVSGSKRSADSTAVDAIALIESPRSSNILTYVYKEPAGSYNLTSLVDPGNIADTNNFNSTTNTSNFCIQSADPLASQAKVVLTGGQGQDVIQLSFTISAGDCNGS